MSVESATATVCDRCQEELAGAVYEMRALEGKVARCLACALVYGPFVRRSAFVALVVGSLLVAINQGNVNPGRRRISRACLEGSPDLRCALLCGHVRCDPERENQAIAFTWL